MSRNTRTPAPPSRRIALSFGTAAGAAVIAASFSMGTAPVAGADVSDADAVSSLVGALDPSAFSAGAPIRPRVSPIRPWVSPMRPRLSPPRMRSAT